MQYKRIAFKVLANYFYFVKFCKTIILVLKNAKEVMSYGYHTKKEKKKRKKKKDRAKCTLNDEISKSLSVYLQVVLRK